MTKLELLAPARTAEIGIEAIKHGADAVYIGAPRFGARVAAGNSVDDISRLVDYAHRFNAKVYVTINTIFDDKELDDVRKLINELYEIHVDALIVQDMGLLKLDLPPIPLHASTQMDNRTPEKVRFLKEKGFHQVVLARELSLDEIRKIHEKCPEVSLEVFVHGALCVSLSGQCYASECLFGRSANRGECAQVCRMEYDLIQQTKSKGEVRILSKKHLLSLKDLCLLDSLKELIEAGAVSFKIEGRLKDASYVKNVTAAYSQALNKIIKENPDKYERASIGNVDYKFMPDVNKSFNRGFTSYFLHGRNNTIFSFDTPKSLGQEVGIVKDIGRGWFTVAGISKFANGDGLCFVDHTGKLFGMRINKVENGRLYPLNMPRNLQVKTRLYRNLDKHFEDVLQHDSAERYIPVDILMDETSVGFKLTLNDDYGTFKSIEVECQKELARTHQSENIKRQLSKLGDTKFRLRNLNIAYKKNWFIPSSLLSEWRRMLVKDTELYVVKDSLKKEESKQNNNIHQFTLEDLDVLNPVGLNIYNNQSWNFYEDEGLKPSEWAYERNHQGNIPVMYCKHCIKYAMGWCLKHRCSGRNANDGNVRLINKSIEDKDSSLYLALANGQRFRLEFDCKRCMMKVYHS